MQAQHVIKAMPVTDGAGVRINRIAGPRLTPLLDPYLMIDEIRSSEHQDYMAGFPAHPHRGFETITYLRRGQMKHEDHLGHKRRMTDGGVQWMTTGRGIIHSEMPEPSDGLFHGFQIWLNLPSELKMSTPAYHDLSPETLRTHKLANGSLKLIAGKLTVDDKPFESVFLTDTRTQPVVADLTLEAGGSADVSVPSGANLLIYVYEGAEAEVPAGHAAIYEQGHAALKTASGMKALVLAGLPLREPVFQHGPFVMNTKAEIEQAMRDYADGRLAR